MDPRRLLVFRAVARAGSLSAAARELGWTQPAVSQQINRLEREAGSPLLLRGATGSTPTEAGRALLARADAIAVQLHMASEELAAMRSLGTGRVRLVAFPSGAASLAPRALRELRADHPGITIELTEAEPPEAAEAVLTGAADLGLVFDHGGPRLQDGLEWLPLMSEPVELVVHAAHPAATGPVRLAELSDQEWIAGCPRCRAHLMQRCHEAGFVPRLSYETDDYVAVQSLVAARLGVTLLPRSALATFRHPDVAVRSGEEFGRRRIGLVFRAGAEQVPANRALIDQFVAAVGDLAGSGDA